jgi:type II secretory pathway pseudopilin PulG
MFKKIVKINRGNTLIEMLFYISIFGMLSAVVTNSMVVMFKSFKEVTILREITQGAQIMERISREIRQANSINALNSSSDLALNTKNTAGNNKIIEFLLTDNNVQIIESDIRVLSVGDALQGGKVAYILKSGDAGYVADGKTRGIISALTNQSTVPVGWGYNNPCASTNIAGADGIAIGTGHQNTHDMIAASCVNGVQLVHGVMINGYNDWYLPSKDELNKLWINSSILGIPPNYYWSSSERDAGSAWEYGVSGSLDYMSKNNGLPYVHAVRDFVDDNRSYLNSPNIKVTALSFEQITTQKGKAIKVFLTISSNHDIKNRSYHFYDTVVLRGNY